MHIFAVAEQPLRGLLRDRIVQFDGVFHAHPVISPVPGGEGDAAS